MLTPTTAAVTVLVRSTSLTLKLPVAFRLPLVSLREALLELPDATVISGTSLVPEMVTVTVRAIEAPLPSRTLKEKVSSLVWPAARYSTALAATE